MKLSLALSALIATSFAPTVIKAECINLLDNSRGCLLQLLLPLGFQLFRRPTAQMEGRGTAWLTQHTGRRATLLNEKVLVVVGTVAHDDGK